MTHCHISNQISKFCNEPEAIECPICYSSMTEENVGSHDFLKCDNPECAETIELNLD